MQKLLFPSRPHYGADLQWVAATYYAVHMVLDSPVYAGVYLYGRTRQERYIDDAGQLRSRLRRLVPSEWQVMLRDHQEGYIDWQTYEMNRARSAGNAHPTRRPL